MKYYSKKAIVILAFFFGPLAGGYLLSRNFKKLGEEKAAKTALITTIILTLLIFTGLAIIPENASKKIPNSLIPLVCAICFTIFYDRFQKTKIQEMYIKGAANESGWKATGIGFVCLLLTVIYYFSFVFIRFYDLRTIEYTIGAYYERKEDGVNALKWFHRSADRGFPTAYTAIGIQYTWGRGVAQDYGEALNWFRKGAELGDAESQYNIGVFYTKGQAVKEDYSEALKWYEKAANQGYAQAQYNLGLIYLEMKNENEKAMEWFRKAAEQDFLEAQYNLGVLYESGMGVEKNKEEAIKWYRKAEKRGSVEARQALEELAK